MSRRSAVTTLHLRGVAIGLAFAAVLPTAAACGDEHATRKPGANESSLPTTSEASPSTSVDGAGSTVPVSPVELVGAYQRSPSPEGAPDAPFAVVVPSSIGEVWTAWGPTELPAPPAPDIASDARVIVVWAAGAGMTFDGYRVTADGLQLVGTEHLLGPDCIGPAVVEGQTYVLVTRGADVVPGMAIAEPDLRQVEDGC